MNFQKIDCTIPEKYYDFNKKVNNNQIMLHNTSLVRLNYYHHTSFIFLPYVIYLYMYDFRQIIINTFVCNNIMIII